VLFAKFGGGVTAWVSSPSYASASSSSSEDADESDGSSSYDEGSYDGRAGQIVYSCEDDEAIAQGSPGATMYDHNIRET
jgi:hypothetical protein